MQINYHCACGEARKLKTGNVIRVIIKERGEQRVIFTQIAAFVVLVAVPVGAALYCAYAFFKKRHQMVWMRKDVYILCGMLVIAVLYTACLGREHLRHLFFPLLVSSSLYLLMRIIALWRDIRKGRPVASTELYGETAIIYISLLVMLGVILDSFREIIPLFSPLFLRTQYLFGFTLPLAVFIPFAFLTYQSWKKNGPKLAIHISIASVALVVILIFAAEALATVLSLFLLCVGLPAYWLRVFIKGRRHVKQSPRFPIIFYPVGLACAGIVCFYFPMLLATPVHRITIQWFFTFFAWLLIPVGLILWFGRVYFKHGFMTRQSVGVSFVAACYVLSQISWMTVQFNYYPMFVKEYRCSTTKPGEKVFTFATGRGRPPSAPSFYRFFIDEPWWGFGDLKFCPKGRTHIKMYERSLYLKDDNTEKATSIKQSDGD